MVNTFYRLFINYFLLFFRKLNKNEQEALQRRRVKSASMDRDRKLEEFSEKRRREAEEAFESWLKQKDDAENDERERKAVEEALMKESLNCIEKRHDSNFHIHPWQQFLPGMMPWLPPSVTIFNKNHLTLRRPSKKMKKKSLLAF